MSIYVLLEYIEWCRKRGIKPTKEGEVIFTKDEEAQFSTLEELELQIAESFTYSCVDAEEYARKLKYLCLTEYSNKFKGVR